MTPTQMEVFGVGEGARVEESLRKAGWEVEAQESLMIA